MQRADLPVCLDDACTDSLNPRLYCLTLKAAWGHPPTKYWARSWDSARIHPTPWPNPAWLTLAHVAAREVQHGERVARSSLIVLALWEAHGLPPDISVIIATIACWDL